MLEFPVLYSGSLLIICFIYSNVYVITKILIYLSPSSKFLISLLQICQKCWEAHHFLISFFPSQRNAVHTQQPLQNSGEAAPGRTEHAHHPCSHPERLQ